MYHTKCMMRFLPIIRGVASEDYGTYAQIPGLCFVASL